MSKEYRLISSRGEQYYTTRPGELGGNSKSRIYGHLDCTAANSALALGYAKHRVFFANETDAIAAGYRPCGRCMRAEYNKWKASQD